MNDSNPNESTSPEWTMIDPQRTYVLGNPEGPLAFITNTPFGWVIVWRDRTSEHRPDTRDEAIQIAQAGVSGAWARIGADLDRAVRQATAAEPRIGAEAIHRITNLIGTALQANSVSDDHREAFAYIQDALLHTPPEFVDAPKLAALSQVLTIAVADRITESGLETIVGILKRAGFNLVR